MKVVVNVDLGRQPKLDQQIMDLCLFAVAVCIVVVGSLLVIVRLLHSVGGLLRGIYWAWDRWINLDLFNPSVEWVAVTTAIPRPRS